MPTFDITAPDGTTYEIEGANAQGALAALQKHLGASSAPAAPTLPTEAATAYDPMGAPTGAEARAPVQANMPYSEQMSKVGQTLDNAARMAANGATFGMADKFAGGMDALTGRAPYYDAGAKAQRAETQKLRETSPAAAVDSGAGVACLERRSIVGAKAGIPIRLRGLFVHRAVSVRILAFERVHGQRRAIVENGRNAHAPWHHDDAAERENMS